MNINETLKNDYNMLCKDYKKATKKIEKQQQEIERLNNIINKAIEYIKENACYGIQEKCCLDDLNYNDCDKLLEMLGDKENE